jgi:hypothetical protein
MEASAEASTAAWAAGAKQVFAMHGLQDLHICQRFSARSGDVKIVPLR